MTPLVARFDAAVESFVARTRGHAALDRSMYALSELGNHSAVWHGVNALDALTGGATARRAALRRSTVQAAEQALVNGPIKLIVRRERPSHISDHPHDLRIPITSSFPSGHATAGFCAATLLAADGNHPALWYALATAIGWSRVHVGVHHPSDVVGGAAIGVVLAVVAGRLWPSAHTRAR